MIVNITDWERALMARVAELEQDAARYRWLQNNVSETPLNMRQFSSDICPDTRLIWKLPMLISTTCINGQVSFAAAIDAAMKAAP